MLVANIEQNDNQVHKVFGDLRVSFGCGASTIWNSFKIFELESRKLNDLGGLWKWFEDNKCKFGYEWNLGFKAWVIVELI